MAIKAIIFDFFGVICSDQYWNYVKADRQSAGTFREYAEEVNLGEMSWSDFVAKIAQATHTSVDEVKELYRSERINPRMAEWIADLHGRYKTGLITNAHHEFIDPLLKRSHLAKHLDSVVVSSRLGVIKPDPAIFEAALEELGCAPEEVIFMDDLDRHVEAARKVGIQAFRFDDFTRAKQRVDRLLNHT
ncbi:MAG: HAD family phosphatase [Candidatus Saccharibacteria bacterium]|nr:HAD family phosphatase [Candidatus Saccharibacteria bacterium]